MKKGFALAMTGIPFLILSACTVGPDYAGAPEVAPLSVARGKFRSAETADAAKYPAAEWWRDVKDADMAKAIDLALVNSPNVEIAVARLRQSRAELRGARAELMPQIANSSSATRARVGLGNLSDRANEAVSEAGTAIGLPAVPTIPDHVSTDFYNVAFDASWEIDIFGGRRRAVEGAVAQAQAADAALADVYVQLSAEVAHAYVGLRSAQRLLAISENAAALQERTLGLTRQQADRGTASELDVARLETQLANTKADIPAMRAQVDEGWNQLSLLMGLEPGGAENLLARSRAIPRPPVAVAVDDPASMLRRRPDIRQAERQLAASNAAIGQAVASYFPRVTLIGFASTGGTDPDDLFRANSISLLGGPTLQWNILDFGRNRANVERGNAAFEQAFGRYRNTVLSALQDAETSLSRFRHQKQNMAELAKANDAATRAARLARELHEAGTLNLIDTLDVERQRLQAEQGLAQSQAQVMNAFIALEKSLGLGWKASEEAQKAVATVVAAPVSRKTME